MQLVYGERRFTIAGDDLLIGSDPGAQVRLTGLRVLPRHAVVKRLSDTLVIVQAADPQAAIQVNGTAIGPEPTPLLNGDRLSVGAEELRIVDPAAVPPSESACGRLVSLTDGRVYSIDVAPFVIGRNPDASIAIASPDASRRHAEVVSLPEGDVLVNLSNAGTFINGEQVVGRQILKALDVVRIGADEFRYYPPPKRRVARMPDPPAGAEFRLGDTLMGMPTPRPMPPAVKAQSPTPATLASLLVKRGERRGERFAVRGAVAALGRADYNDIQVPDASVSARHAKLEVREGVWIISDVGSTNGTFVDELPVREETALSPGCIIRLGDVQMMFEPRDEARPAPRPSSAPPADTAVPREPAASADRTARSTESPRAERSKPKAPEPRGNDRRSSWVAIVLIVILAAMAAYLLLA